MRVFVTVGTHSQQFNRLLQKVDGIAGERKDFVFFAQTGNSSYAPKNFSYKKFLREKEYGGNFKKADVVVSHGGAGSIINSLRFGKPLIVVPRLERFGEHTNDHQLELAEFFAERGKCICVEEIGGLEAILRNAVKFKPKIEEDRYGLIREIKKSLRCWGNE